MMYAQSLWAAKNVGPNDRLSQALIEAAVFDQAYVSSWNLEIMQKISSHEQQLREEAERSRKIFFWFSTMSKITASAALAAVAIIVVLQYYSVDGFAYFIIDSTPHVALIAFVGVVVLISLFDWLFWRKLREGIELRDFEASVLKEYLRTKRNIADLEGRLI